FEGSRAPAPLGTTVVVPNPCLAKAARHGALGARPGRLPPQAKVKLDGSPAAVNQCGAGIPARGRCQTQGPSTALKHSYLALQLRSDDKSGQKGEPKVPRLR